MRKRRFEMQARPVQFADREQQVRQIDMAVGIARMMPHRLAEQRARRLAMPGLERQRAEIVERAEIGRVTADQLEIVALGLLEAALFAQQAGAFGKRRDAVRIALQRGIELAQPRAARGPVFVCRRRKLCRCAANH